MNTEEIVLGLEERLRIAQLTSDVEELDLLIDDSLVFTGLDGNIVSKQDDLNLHRSDEFEITKMELVDRQILPLENAMVVISLMYAAANVSGAAQCGRIRYTRVWSKFSENWRLVVGHMSIVQI